MTRLFWHAYHSICDFVFAHWSLIINPPLVNGEPHVIRRFHTYKAARVAATSLNDTLNQKLLDVGEGLEPTLGRHSLTDRVRSADRFAIVDSL